MLQGRSSARGGQMKGRTAALMFRRNNRKKHFRKYHCFSGNKKNSGLIRLMGDKEFLTDSFSENI
jgi:hypothetical protein